MTRAVNKITFAWNDTANDPTILTDPDWVVDPVFEDEAFATKIGPQYWTFTGNYISTPSQSDYDLIVRAQVQNQMWLNIQGERDRRKGTGGYKVGNYWFHSDDTSRIQQIALVIMGAGMPAGIMWKTLSGAFVPMTPTLAGQIFQAAAASDISIFSVAESKKVAMLAASTPANYDYLSGWPKAYGE